MQLGFIEESLVMIKQYEGCALHEAGLSLTLGNQENLIRFYPLRGFWKF